MADFTRRGRPIDTVNGAVAGFVAPGDDDVDWIRNGDFARGWDGWATEGGRARERRVASGRM